MFHILISWHETENCGFFDVGAEDFEWYEATLPSGVVIALRMMLLEDLGFREVDKHAITEEIRRFSPQSET